MNTTIIVALIGTLSTILMGLLGMIVGRKIKSEELRGKQIDNNKSEMDNQKQQMKLMRDMQASITNLQTAVYEVLAITCKDKTCVNRQPAKVVYDNSGIHVIKGDNEEDSKVL